MDEARYFMLLQLLYFILFYFNGWGPLLHVTTVTLLYSVLLYWMSPVTSCYYSYFTLLCSTLMDEARYFMLLQLLYFTLFYFNGWAPLLHVTTVTLLYSVLL